MNDCSLCCKEQIASNHFFFNNAAQYKRASRKKFISECESKDKTVEMPQVKRDFMIKMWVQIYIGSGTATTQCTTS